MNETGNYFYDLLEKKYQEALSNNGKQFDLMRQYADHLIKLSKTNRLTITDLEEFKNTIPRNPPYEAL